MTCVEMNLLTKQKATDSNVLLSNVRNLCVFALQKQPPLRHDHRKFSTLMCSTNKRRRAWDGSCRTHLCASAFLQKRSRGSRCSDSCCLKPSRRRDCGSKRKTKREKPNAALLQDVTPSCVALSKLHLPAPLPPLCFCPLLQQYPPTDITGQLNLSDPSVSTVVWGGEGDAWRQLPMQRGGRGEDGEGNEGGGESDAWISATAEAGAFAPAKQLGERNNKITLNFAPLIFLFLQVGMSRR